MFRTRSRSSGALFGSVRRSHSSDGVFIDYTPMDLLPTRTELTSDDGGPLGSHYFYSDKFRLTNVNGITTTYDYDGIRYELRNYLPNPVAVLSYAGHLIAPSLQVPTDGGALAVELLKRTNPSRPSVSLPQAMGEFREDLGRLPDTIKEKGANYFGSRLGVRFGLLPIVSDALKLVRLSESVDKRSRELVRLGNKGGARVMRVLENRHVMMEVPPDNTGSYDPYIHGSVLIDTRSRIWGQCRWKPDTSFNTYVQGGKVNRQKIRSLLLGIQSEKGSTGFGRDAWNLIPFSWMTDWCVNVGDLLAANQNDGLAHPENVAIMQQLSTTRTFISAQGRITLEHITKIRCYPPYLQLTWSLPSMTADQMLILTDLIMGNRSSKPRSHGSGGILPPPVG